MGISDASLAMDCKQRYFGSPSKLLTPVASTLRYGVRLSEEANSLKQHLDYHIL